MPAATKGSFSKGQASKVGSKVYCGFVSFGIYRRILRFAEVWSELAFALSLSQADGVAKNGLPVTAVSKATLHSQPSLEPILSCKLMLLMQSRA